jgi:hypothetical protein
MTIFWDFPLGSSDISEETASPIFWMKGFGSGKCFNIDNSTETGRPSVERRPP